jgi:hypothetical protein
MDRNIANHLYQLYIDGLDHYCDMRAKTRIVQREQAATAR